MRLTRATAFIGLLTVLPVLSAGAETASAVFARVSPSVVVVLSLDETGQPLALGSGVVVPGNEVVTNCHVVNDGGSFQVQYHQRKYAAQLRYYDLQRDVCALTVPGLRAPAVELGDTRTVKVGATVFAVGAPEGLELSMSEGIVSGLRTLHSAEYIQTTAAISHGSSGGGLFDDNGRLLGLTTFYLKGGEQLNFALPVEWIKDLPSHCTTLNERAFSLESSGYSSKQPNYSKLIEADLDYLCGSPQWQFPPHGLTGWGQLGSSYSDAHQYSNAYGALRKAIALDPSEQASWRDLGSVYMEENQPKKAIYPLKEAVRLEPTDLGALYELGASYHYAGDEEKAYGVYKQLQGMSPELAQKYFDDVIGP